MKYIDKKLYIEYLKTLDILELSDEYNYLSTIKNNLFDIYETIILKLKNDISLSTIDNIYDNLVSIKKYLVEDVKNFLDNKNLNISKAVYDTLSEKTIIKELSKLYDDIFKVPTPQDPFFGFEPMNYKELKVSYYEALMNLYISLYRVINQSINVLENSNNSDINEIIDNVIFAAEEYLDEYIIFEHKFKKVLTPIQYDILLKHDCLKELTRLATEEGVVAVDITDIENYFKNAIITKIINHGKKITLASKASNQLIFIMHSKDEKLLTFSERVNFYKQKYTPEIDECIMGLYYGEKNELVIYMYKENKN